MWNFIGAHPFTAVAIGALLIIIIAAIIGIIASAVNSGKEVEAGVGATGFKLKFGAKEKREKKEEDITANIAQGIGFPITNLKVLCLFFIISSGNSIIAKLNLSLRCLKISAFR